VQLGAPFITLALNRQYHNQSRRWELPLLKSGIAFSVVLSCAVENLSARIATPGSRNESPYCF
jgi:hypothetical protein